MIKNKDHNSQELIALALYQLMHTHTYEEISVKDICDKAGVSRMSFYRSFNKKDDIFINFCDAKFEEFYNDLIKSKISRPEEFVLMLFEHILKYKRQLLIVKQAKKLALLKTQFENYGRYVINKLDSTFDVNYMKNNPITIPFLVGGFFSVLVSWIEDDFKLSPKEMTKNLIDLFDPNYQVKF